MLNHGSIFCVHNVVIVFFSGQLVGVTRKVRGDSHQITDLEQKVLESLLIAIY